MCPYFNGVKDMNKSILYIVLSAFTLGLGFSSCSSDNEPDPNVHVYAPQSFQPTVFDSWLKRSYVDAYNVDFKYRMETNEIDRTKHLSPSTLENSMKLAKIVRHAWFGVYDQVAGVHFMRSYAPRVIVLVGSNAYNGDGTITLGTAEGGMRVTLYSVNSLNLTDPDYLNQMYFHTMHHEFGHILHQNKPWPLAFNEVTRGDYLPSGYFQPAVNRMDVYAPLGFVSAYARSKDSEDITEVTAAYITYTDAHWARLYAAAGASGKAKIDKKIEIMKTYMKESWNIDMDQLRDEARRRSAEVLSPAMVLVDEEWKPLLDNSGFRSTSQLASMTGAPLSEEGIRRQAVIDWLLGQPVMDLSRYPRSSERCQLVGQYCRH